MIYVFLSVLLLEIIDLDDIFDAPNCSSSLTGYIFYLFKLAFYLKLALDGYIGLIFDTFKGFYDIMFWQNFYKLPFLLFTYLSYGLLLFYLGLLLT